MYHFNYDRLGFQADQKQLNFSILNRNVDFHNNVIENKIERALFTPYYIFGLLQPFFSQYAVVLLQFWLIIGDSHAITSMLTT